MTVFISGPEGDLDVQRYTLDGGMRVGVHVLRHQAWRDHLVPFPRLEDIVESDMDPFFHTQILEFHWGDELRCCWIQALRLPNRLFPLVPGGAYMTLEYGIEEGVGMQAQIMGGGEARSVEDWDGEGDAPFCYIERMTTRPFE